MDRRGRKTYRGRKEEKAPKACGQGNWPLPLSEPARETKISVDEKRGKRGVTRGGEVVGNLFFIRLFKTVPLGVSGKDEGNMVWGVGTGWAPILQPALKGAKRGLRRKPRKPRRKITINEKGRKKREAESGSQRKSKKGMSLGDFFGLKKLGPMKREKKGRGRRARGMNRYQISCRCQELMERRRRRGEGKERANVLRRNQGESPGRGARSGPDMEKVGGKRAEGTKLAIIYENHLRGGVGGGCQRWPGEKKKKKWHSSETVDRALKTFNKKNDAAKMNESVWILVEYNLIKTESITALVKGGGTCEVSTTRLTRDVKSTETEGEIG